MNTEALASLAAGLGYDVRTGFGADEIETGNYHIVGTDVILRQGPSSTTPNIGTLNNGENVYAFGDTELDTEHMVGPNGIAVTNDGSSPGIQYVRVGTQTHGPGWVAINFMAPGAGGAHQAPKPEPSPTPAPTPTTPATSASTKKDKVTTFLIGGLIGVAVLGGVVLLVKHSKSPRRLAHA